MASTEDGWHTLPDGHELYSKTWKTASDPIAVVVFIHGFSDHVDRYGDCFPNLAAAGVQVHAFDQRGWGRSVKMPSQKGLTGPTSRVIADITSIIESHLPPPAPLFLMGHSMGGQETLYYAARGPASVRRQISGYIALAPWIQLHPRTQPGWFKLNAGKFVCKFLPHRQMVQAPEAQYMSHDEALNKDWEMDPLCHDTATLEGLAGMLARGDELHEGIAAIDDVDGCHLFIAHGTEDMVTSVYASKSYFERCRARDKTLKLYDGSYHCIHLDIRKAQLMADVLDFIKGHLGSSVQADQSSSKL